MLVQNTSKVRSWVQAKKHYEIGSLNEAEAVPGYDDEPEERKMDPDFEKFMKLGGLGKKAKNDKRPKDKGPQSWDDNDAWVHNYPKMIKSKKY